jgi:hypothetical protein
MADEKDDIVFNAVLNMDDFNERGFSSALKGIEATAKGAAAEVDRIGQAAKGIDTSVSINATVDDSDLRTAKGLHDEINTNTSTTTNVEDSELDDVKSKLDDIRALATIDIVFQVAEGLGGLQELPILSSILEVDEAMARLEGTTGRMIPDAEHLINDLYVNAWGESRSAIADVVTEAGNLAIANEDIEQAITTAFQVADTQIGDTTEVLRTMDSLVKNDLANSFQEAGDLIVAGLQNGANRGEDLLDTFNEYGSTFAELEISGQGALALINSGLEAGIDNSDRIADAIRETGIRLREIGTDENIAGAFSRLDELSSVDLSASFDAYNAGEISGDEFFNGFFQALSEASASNPEEASTIAATLVGTISEDFGTEAVSQLSTTWDSTMGTLEGRAATASDTINNTLGTSLTGLGRTIEQELVTTAEDIIDIDALTEKVKTAAQTIGSELRAGATLGEALEVGLELGEGTFTRLESVIGNIGLVIMQALAGALDLLGQGEAAEQLRQSIEGAAGGQLAFDLKLADDGAGVQEAVRNALSRGVDSAAVGEAAITAVNESLARGDFEGAQAIVDAITQAAGEGTSQVSADVATTVNSIFAGVANDYGRGLLQEALGDVPPELATYTQLLNAIETVIPQLEASGGFLGNDTLKADQLQAVMDEIRTMGEIGEVDTTNLQGLIDTATLAGDTVNTAIDETIMSAPEAGTALSEQMGAPGKEAFEEVGTAAGNTTNDIVLFADTTKTKLEESKVAFADWSATSIEQVNLLAERLVYAEGVLAGLTTDLGTASGATSTGEGGGETATTDAPAAEGGTRRGTFLVGERGPEIVTTDERVAVLNNRSTRSMFAFLDAMTKGRLFGGGNPVNRNNTINQTNYIQSQAQGVNLAQRNADIVRTGI